MCVSVSMSFCKLLSSGFMLSASWLPRTVSQSCLWSLKGSQREREKGRERWKAREGVQVMWMGRGRTGWVTDPGCLHFKSMGGREKRHMAVSISSEKSTLQFKQAAPLCLPASQMIIDAFGVIMIINSCIIMLLSCILQQRREAFLHLLLVFSTNGKRQATSHCSTLYHECKTVSFQPFIKNIYLTAEGN